MTPELAIVLSGLLSGLLCGGYSFFHGIKLGKQIAEWENDQNENKASLERNASVDP